MSSIASCACSNTVGPDASGIFVGEEAIIAQNRLSIIDVATVNRFEATATAFIGLG